MAVRPVFLPVEDGPLLVEERNFEFTWAPGFSETQKKKNVSALHDAARRSGIGRLLEISTKSEIELGRRLSAFSLKINVEGRMLPLESVYQSAKEFRESGPFLEIMDMPPRDAKRFIRENGKGDLIGFRFLGQNFPLWPKNAFYDWLYIRALLPHNEWIKEKVLYDGFTDIEFNPQKQVNCQARAFAEYVSMQRKSLLMKAADDFRYFSSLCAAI
ncbi:DarT1-associated NADAR antitoxin family protein [Azospirillum sp. B2RO_4]|uniref:DarT1-associated NADAR antitoxin family protein n=1 Tax=Azospirillum sp. B2RO_4 TaxID=3027796 RepID=UPI003DA7B256